MTLRYDIEAISRWLVSAPCRELSAEALLTKFSERVVSAGIPLWRSTFSLRTMHPEVFAEGLVWRAGRGVSPRTIGHGELDSPAFIDSPVSVILGQQAQGLRCRLERPRDKIPYPVCRELAEEGATDYLLNQLPAKPPSLVSYSTKAIGGFTREQVFALGTLTDPLAARVELASHAHATSSLLRTYLGQNAARRVLQGKFLRGGGERIRAVIWMSDLRDFTRFVDRGRFDEVMPALDTYFGCVTDAIHKEGGEVLKFIGDAVLAVFPVGPATEEQASRAAVRAAEAALEELDEINARRKRAHAEPIHFGVALHLGEVIYGNIGSKDRLDFTVIGSAVNETSRLESMCKELGTSLVLSGPVAAQVDQGELHPLGEHHLHGVSAPMEIFTLKHYRPEGSVAD